ncbi:hypothetical protein Sru01_49670 [Sphaerisporangium rufum]|uniref:Acyltransferase 3 domain-containing protein n=1 Tax=Sphaerisporangium rufum TaxID=1381558 RepID=A0A919R9V1_9ACTN|nr:hypothetical protein Sru01_49670 [Sphaerisporangium rufum]
MTPGRLDWLDALRGVGATAVLAEHLLPWVVPSLRPYWFNLGIYGVMVFFLVSGYIIPRSLERRGDLRAFWIGRIFRLYPLYLVVIGLVLAMAGWISIPRTVPRDGSAVAAHATMLLDVVGLGGVADTMWTLSYEMVFYLLVAALYTTRTRPAGGGPAVLFGLAAVVMGLLLPAAPLVDRRVAWISCAAFLAGLACVLANRFPVAAARALGVLALALIPLSSRTPWFGAVILAVMFTGTAVHRWERGTGPFWPIPVTAVLVALSPIWALQSGWWWVEPDVWITTLCLAAVTFAAAMALRRRRLPRFLVWTGLISYSLYLLHHPLLKLFTWITGDLRWSPWYVQIPAAVAFVALILAAAALAYRFVERPGLRLGRRFTISTPPHRAFVSEDGH